MSKKVTLKKSEKTEKTEKTEKPKKIQKIEKTEKTKKPKKTEKTEKLKKNQKTEKIEKIEKTVEERYKKSNLHERVFVNPGMFIGSDKPISVEVYIPETDTETNKIKMTKKMIEYIPGLYKIVDELIVNAMDQYMRTGLVKKIKIGINSESITVENDGPGIDIEFHKDEKMYVPELIFGNLLTSENYDETEQRIVGGKNGLGAKLANIFSTKFQLECITKNKKYVQTWTNNMYDKTEPKITETKSNDLVKITFFPDLERFKLKELNSDFQKLIEKRCYDISSCTGQGLSVYFNGKVIKTKTFEDYISLHIGNKLERKRAFQSNEKEEIKKTMNKRRIWEVGACFNPDPSSEFEQVSFVNGIWTLNGGQHVKDMETQITRKLIEELKKNSKLKDLEIKPGYIKNRLMLFVKSTIVNPDFPSQSKEEMVTPFGSFDYRFWLSPDFIKTLSNCGIISEIIEDAEMKEAKKIAKKTDGKKKSNIIGISKYEHAHWAGTKKSGECILFLTEGDSAKAMAMTCYSVVPNARNFIGIFPLRGKLLNVRDATQKQLKTNEEIMCLKQIIGLAENKVYTKASELNYGKILIFTDADVDGHHIKGLIMNFIEKWWPSLPLNIKDFITTLNTPVIKATSKKTKKVIPFYSEEEFDQWKDKSEKNSEKNYNIKYYKGLGTNSKTEAKEFFKKFHDYITSYEFNNNSSELLDKIFNKKRADDRKQWLLDYNPKNRDMSIDSLRVLPINKFINEIFITFSYADNERSIPHICDGLKPSLRKIFYAINECVKKSTKMVEVAGTVIKETHYQHGDASLYSTMTSMAQNFWCSNNINLLFPDGQYGDRNQGGKNASSARYISTKINDIANCIFVQQDAPLLEYSYLEGHKVEPKYYLPIIPMILVNGTQGIGTGFSATIPRFNPLDLVKSIKRLMSGEDTACEKGKRLVPWYSLYKGEIIREKANKYISVGKYQFLGDNTVEITELPVETWSEDYIDFIRTKVIGYTEEVKKMKLKETKKNDKKQKQGDPTKEILVSQHSNCTDIVFKLTISFNDTKLYETYHKNPEKFEKDFKLRKNINMTNMYLYNSEGKLQKYKSVEEILFDFYDLRLNLYQKRYQFMIDKLKSELLLISTKVRYIKETLIGQNEPDNKDGLKIAGLKESAMILVLQERNYSKFLNNGNYLECNSDGNYDFLFNMTFRSLTEEKIKELENEELKKKEKLKELQSKTHKDLWIEDLDNFTEKYKKWYSQLESEN